MVLEYDYGINIGNRFGDLVDHDEDPEEYIAKQTKIEEKPKKSSKDTKTTTTASTKKSSSKTTASTTTTTTPATATNTTNVNSAAKASKENQGGKPVNTDQRKQQTNFSNDNNNNQQPRVDSGRGRGGNRGFSRRGGAAGPERPSYEGGNRGGGQQRSQRFNKFEGQQGTNEPSGFEQAGDAWTNETRNDNQTYSGYRGRGGPRRGGRGRGRGGRGNFNNRNFDGNSQPLQQDQQQQQQSPDTSGIPKSTEPSFDNTRIQSAPAGGQEMDADITFQERPFEPNGARRGGRGQFRSRTFRSSRNYGNDRQSHYENEGGQDDYRQNRRQYDRRPRSYVSTVKPIEKKDGGGAHNWGKQAENPEEAPVTEDTTEVAEPSAPVSKDWAKQVEEAEKQMTLDEYKKQVEEKKRAQQEKLPQFNRRAPGEGEDPKIWQKYSQEYRKKNDNDQSEEEQIEEGDDEVSEDNENEEENVAEQTSGKKRVISIPLHFKPIDSRGGPTGSRGGKRRGTGRFYDRSNRDEQQTSKSANEQQSSSYQYTGEYQSEEQQQQQPQQRQPQQSRPYRGGSRPGYGRGEYRRSYSNSARGSRGGYNRSNTDPKAIDLENTTDFPTLSNK